MKPNLANMFKVFTAVLFLSTGSALAGELNGYTAGELLPSQEIVLQGPGIPPNFCFVEENGFQLDTGFTRTGSLSAKNSRGENLDINLSVPLTQKAGFDEPIDPLLKKKAKELCDFLQASPKGLKIKAIIQRVFEEDEGRRLETLYLRELEAEGFRHQNYSEVYAPLPRRK